MPSAVIGRAASAGGVDALTTVISALPATLPAAVAIANVVPRYVVEAEVWRCQQGAATLRRLATELSVPNLEETANGDT